MFSTINFSKLSLSFKILTCLTFGSAIMSLTSRPFEGSVELSCTISFQQSNVYKCSSCAAPRTAQPIGPVSNPVAVAVNALADAAPVAAP